MEFTFKSHKSDRYGTQVVLHIDNKQIEQEGFDKIDTFIDAMKKTLQAVLPHQVVLSEGIDCCFSGCKRPYAINDLLKTPIMSPDEIRKFTVELFDYLIYRVSVIEVIRIMQGFGDVATATGRAANTQYGQYVSVSVHHRVDLTTTDMKKAFEHGSFVGVLVSMDGDHVVIKDGTITYVRSGIIYGKADVDDTVAVSIAELTKYVFLT